jgi:hypothetical protein
VPTEAIIGGLLFGLIFFVAILAIGQIFWYRADCVSALEESQYTVIPIVSILFRAAGEVYATLGASMAVGGCLFIWMARAYPNLLFRGLPDVMPSFSPNLTFLGGLSFLGYVGVVSFLVLIFFYFLAESVVVMVDMASQIRLLVRHTSPDAPPAPSVPQAPPAPPLPPPPPRCPRCNTQLEAGTKFCGTCGSPIPG